MEKKINPPLPPCSTSVQFPGLLTTIHALLTFTFRTSLAWNSGVQLW